MFESIVLKELVRHGYSTERGKRVWNIATHKLLYSTPQLAQGFLNLMRLPRYKANNIDREIALLRAHVPPFFGGLHDSFNLIDLGCGDGTKAEAFVKSLPRTLRTKYFSVDISMPLTHLAKTRLQSLRSKTFSLGGSFIEDFSNPEPIMKKIKAKSNERNIFLLLGGTLASFEITEFLFSLSRSMKRGDMLVVGNGIRTGKRFVGLEKYKHPLFNEWLMHLMSGLGFSADEVSYNTRFANGRLEFFYTVKKDKVFVCNGKRIKFKAKDEIVVAVQYKYYAAELEKFCRMYFSDVRFFKDKDSEYALILCVK